MKKVNSTRQILISILFILNFQNSFSQFAYLNPMPGSNNHNPQTGLVIRSGSLIDEKSIENNSWLQIIGTKSGTHSFTSKLSDDNKTIIVTPTIWFSYNESVTVRIFDKLRTKTGKKIIGLNFLFDTKSELTQEQQSKFKNAIYLFNNEESGEPNNEVETRDLDLDSLPTFVVTTNNNAAPGQIFYSNTFSGPLVYTNTFATIIENNDSVTWAKDLGESGFHFNINYNGNLTYWDNSFQGWIELDSNYNLIDSILPGNGYETQANHHDCSIYPDGHVLILIVDPQTVDLTEYGGKADATVDGVIIQELDSDRNVIFEWSSWDHFQITDAEDHTSLTGFSVDYVHPNAISRDDDGNIILCCRAFCEVTKINSETGEIMWRLGGENNQFTLLMITYLSILNISMMHIVQLMVTSLYSTTENLLHHNDPVPRNINWMKKILLQHWFGTMNILMFQESLFTARQWVAHKNYLMEIPLFHGAQFQAIWIGQHLQRLTAIKILHGK